ncbi:MAG: hypothetical protein M3393_07530 [Actinomycetota bacterium]|nr:hypothetical protein [Actinomycetota bacterium]
MWCGDEATDGIREISIRADGLEAAAFDDTIGQIADVLGWLGDTGRVDVRRAKAVGVIADPQGTLDLIHDTTTSDTPGSADPATTDQPAGGPVTGGPVTGQASGADAKRRGSRRPRVVLYLHLHQDAGRGVGRVEGLGPVTVDQIREWVGRCEVVITPVLDLDGRASVDAYEVPDRIAETVFPA